MAAYGGNDKGRRAALLAALEIDAWVPRPGSGLQSQVRKPPPPGAPSALAQGQPAPAVAAPSRAEAPPPSVAGGRPPPGVPPVPNLDWEALEARARGCTACGLHQTRQCVVFGVGQRRARWFVVGEAPGADEDRQGEPFVGRAGQLLNEMLRAAGASRDQVYIGNILKCRPPENRDPRPDEVARCISFLQRQIQLVEPGLILAVGRIAAQNLLGVETPIGQLRGRVHRYGEAGVPVVVTYHPAYLLRSPGQKARAWEDLCLARSVMAPA